MKTGILGGGLSGVVLQHFLEDDSEILEKESRIGGLCRTFEKDGFLYDIGGHILFSREPKMMETIKSILGDNINYVKRNNKILYKDRYVKYPFENGLDVLDKEDIFDCLINYINNEYPEPKNFKEWIYYTFGSGIAEKYLIPYNQKIWKCLPEQMSLEWVQRVPKPPVADVLKSALGIETEGYLHQLHFNYPLYGGIESLVKSFAQNGLNAATDFQINKIQKKAGQWLVSDGTDERVYDRLVVTFPLTEAVKVIEDVPAEVIEASESLRYNSVRVILIGVNNESLMDKSAVYIPNSKLIPHRVCFMGYFSKNTVPEGKSSLMAEVTTNPSFEHHKTSDSVLTEMVANNLEQCGIIKQADIVTTDIQNIEFGYIVYDLNYYKNMAVIKNFFKSINVDLLGRFGQFEYINMDEVIKRSKAMAVKLNEDKGRFKTA